MGNINNIFIKNGMTAAQVGSRYSKVRSNREYLLSSKTADELNVYRTFSPFPTLNDAYPVTYDDNGKEIPLSGFGPGTPGVRSLFNKSGAVLLGSSTGSTDVDVVREEASPWRISNNVPLIDNPQSRQKIKSISGCTVKELVDASEAGLLGRETYSYSDFMYCKHLGKVSNNYMVTLRRFPLPVDDYISTLGVNERTDKNITSKNVQSIGCMVTWMNTPGNALKDILKYNVSMPFKYTEANWQELNGTDTQSKFLNGTAALFDPVYRSQYMNGQAGTAANAGIFGKFFNINSGDVPYPADSLNNHYDKNKVYGPVDAIKGSYMRSDAGIEFGQSFTLTFDYELRSYNGINGRQAMLDLISNILNVVYTTGTFWGGGYRSHGSHQNNIFTNLEIFKAKGGATDFFDAIFKDVTTLGKSIFSKLSEDPWGTISSFAGDLLGMAMAANLNRLGRPVKTLLNSLLSPAPVGFWHVTIGNPHHPIMSIGNMILKRASIEHYGPLGLDDFPTGLRVVCELERGKPRDIRDIEKLYMHGNDRIYASMGAAVFDMYRHAKEYKGNRSNKSVLRWDKFKGQDADITKMDDIIGRDELPQLSSVLKKYFGHDDTYSIYVAAAEQEYGSQKKNSRTASGNSSQAGTGGWVTS